MRLALLSSVLLVTACTAADGDGNAQDSTTTAITAAPLSATDLAGTWDLEVRTMTSDSVILTGTMTVDAATGTATQAIGTGTPQSALLTFDGDSVTTSIPPYPSNVRAGMMVATTGVYRLVNGRVEGITTARYQGDTTADSVRQFRGTWIRRP